MNFLEPFVSSLRFETISAYRCRLHISKARLISHCTFPDSNPALGASFSRDVIAESCLFPRSI